MGRVKKKNDEDLVSSIVKNQFIAVVKDTHKKMLKKFPRQKKILDAMLKMRIDKIEKECS